MRCPEIEEVADGAVFSEGCRASPACQLSFTVQSQTVISYKNTSKVKKEN